MLFIIKKKVMQKMWVTSNTNMGLGIDGASKRDMFGRWLRKQVDGCSINRTDVFIWDLFFWQDDVVVRINRCTIG